MGNPGGGGPHGPLRSTDARGGTGAAPQTGPLAIVRREVSTTSSSSVARAEDPRTFGLGDRRTGEADPDPDCSVGRAMGWMGRGGPIGPGSAMMDCRLPEPGASIEGGGGLGFVF
jgi:hypothetical protein